LCYPDPREIFWSSFGVTAKRSILSGPAPWKIVVFAWTILALVSLGSHALESVAEKVSDNPSPGRAANALGRMAGLVEEIENEVPPRDGVLVDTWQAPRVPADQFLERELAYWVFPRRVYSAAAIKRSGRTLSEFVSQRRIRWGVKGLALVPVNPDRVDQDFSDGRQSEPPPVSGNTRLPSVLAGPGVVGWLLVVLGMGICVAAGRGTLQLLGLDVEISGRWERLAWSWLVGVFGMAIIAMVAFVIGWPVHPLVALLPAVILVAVGGLVGRRSRTTPEPLVAGPASPPASFLVIGLGGLVVLASLGIAVSRGIDGFDQRMQWAYKARLMLDQAGPRGESVFQDTDHVHFHPRYPLLVPASEAVLGGLGGGLDAGSSGFREVAAVVLFPLSLLAAAVVLGGSLCRLEVAHGAVGGLMLLVLPAWCGFDYGRDNLAAFNGCPEQVLGIGLLAAAASGLAGWREGHRGWYVLSGLFLVVAGLAKAEGAVHVVVMLVTSWLLMWRAGKATPRRFAVGVGLVVLAVLLVHELVFTRVVVGGILPDDYRELLTPTGVLAGIPRLPRVAGHFLFTAFLSPRFGALGLLLLLTAWQSRGRWRQAEVAWPLATCGLMLAACCLPFLVIPRWEDNLEWAAGRLVAELTPLAVWTLAVLVLPAAKAVEGTTGQMVSCRPAGLVNPLSGDGARVG